MKLKNLIPLRYRTTLIRQFGHGQIQSPSWNWMRSCWNRIEV